MSRWHQVPSGKNASMDCLLLLSPCSSPCPILTIWGWLHLEEKLRHICFHSFPFSKLFTKIQIFNRWFFALIKNRTRKNKPPSKNSEEGVYCFPSFQSSKLLTKIWIFYWSGFISIQKIVLETFSIRGGFLPWKKPATSNKTTFAKMYVSIFPPFSLF